MSIKTVLPRNADRNHILRLIALAIPMRLVVDTTMRMFYPFLPAMSRGLGISLAQGGLLMSLRSAMILFSPVFGVWNDRHGPRALLVGALLVQGVALWWLSAVQGLVAAIPPMLLLGLGGAAFIPTLQAAISGQVPFERRGRVLGIVEFSWALTGLIILPLIGILLVAQGWQTPLRLVGVAALVAAPLPLLLPLRSQVIERARHGLRQMAGLVWHSRSARAAVVVNGLMFIAAEAFFVTYGAWLEQSFGLAPDAIGRIAALLGVAELTGSGASSLFIDRVGKRRGVAIGLLAMTLSFLALPLLGRTVLLATVGMFIFTVSFEFSIVSNIGLMSEQVPNARGTVLALGAMAGALTRAFSGFGGLLVFEWRGLPATALLGALGSGIGLLVLWRWVQERPEFVIDD